MLRLIERRNRNLVRISLKICLSHTKGTIWNRLFAAVGPYCRSVEVVVVCKSVAHEWANDEWQIINNNFVIGKLVSIYPDQPHQYETFAVMVREMKEMDDI